MSSQGAACLSHQYHHSSQWRSSDCSDKTALHERNSQIDNRDGSMQIKIFLHCEIKGSKQQQQQKKSILTSCSWNSPLWLFLSAEVQIRNLCICLRNMYILLSHRLQEQKWSLLKRVNTSRNLQGLHEAKTSPTRLSLKCKMQRLAFNTVKLRGSVSCSGPWMSGLCFFQIIFWQPVWHQFRMQSFS